MIVIGSNPIILPDGAAASCSSATECAVMGTLWLGIGIGTLILLAVVVVDWWRDR